MSANLTHRAQLAAIDECHRSLDNIERILWQRFGIKVKRQRVSRKRGAK